MTRSIYVISDLHIGGAYGVSDAPDVARRRGFRMMDHAAELARFIGKLADDAPAGQRRELVINGDFIDFLAEEHDEPRFRPFLSDDGLALRTFETIVTRKADKPIFDALAAFTEKGHQLTILLGNHDVELSLPDVRAALTRTVAPAAPRSLRFVYDGEALVYGDALIEHGNAYDPANVVDHETLTRVRGLRSRGFRGKVDRFFDPPPGSRLVASVMNPIKSDYGFIDLLKPESEPLFALLLAIAPQYRKELGRAALALRAVPRHLLPRWGVPGYLANINAEGSTGGGFEQDISGGESAADRALREVLASSIGDDAAGGLLAEAAVLGDEDGESASHYEDNIASVMDRVRAGIGLVRLFINGNFASLDQRIDMVQAALRALAEDTTFDDTSEAPRYLNAATQLSNGAGSGSPFRYVVFGHTHHAKDITLDDGARYLNTGTWANLMRFPAALLDADKAKARAALRTFVERVAKNELGEYIDFRPTYVRLELADETRVQHAELQTFDERIPL